MKIAIAAPSPVPFLVGGAEKFLWGLQAAINQLTPHDAELIKLPCRDQEFWPLMEAYERFHRLDLTYFDRVISTKYPAWMVRHPEHDVYMQHPCRGVYDLYHKRRKKENLPGHSALDRLRPFLENPAPDSSLIQPFFNELFALRGKKDLPQGLFEFPGPVTRAAIRFLDRAALSGDNIRRYFAISRNVVLRDGYFPEEADVKAVNHPTDIRGLYNRSYDYVFTASRLEDLKRVDLLIEAFKRVSTDTAFKIAGTGGQEEKLRRAAAGDERIEFLGFVQDSELADYYAGALFVPFIPYDEDYGLVTLEAMLSGKAVLTCRDAGGVTELVTNEENGLVTEPEPAKLAEAMTRMIQNRDETIRMGRAGKEKAGRITWENTVSELLGTPAAGREADVSRLSAGGAGRRKKIVVINDYPAALPVSGGQKRICHMCRNLASAADVTLAAFGGAENPGHRDSHQPSVRICEGAKEIRFPKSRAQAKAEKRLSRQLRASVDDIAAINCHESNPEYLGFLERMLEDAELAVLAHPYLFHAVRKVWSGPLWLDAHNVEADMKEIVLPETRGRQEALELVKETERSCIKDAELVSCVSEKDKDRLKELYGDLPDCLVVPNGMDFSYASGFSGMDRQGLVKRLGVSAPIAVFVGSNHAPNNQALEELCGIAAESPGIAFFVIGTVCGSIPQERVPENMRLFGVLPEEEKAVVLRASSIALNPVCRGGGTNLKIIEYAAYSLPVLSTPQGARGFDLEDGRHILVRELHEFPGALESMTLPEMKQEMEEMAERARRKASLHYDWSVVFMPLAERLSNRINQGKQGPA